jgi:hypothetical protein
MKPASKNNFYLEVIPVLLDNQNHVCLKGQAFPVEECTLHVYSALSYKNIAWYSDIQGEEPMTEYELYDNGRDDALVGYGLGLHKFNLVTGERTFMPITIKEFLMVRSKSSKVSLNDSLIPKILSIGSDGTYYKTVYGDVSLNTTPLGIIFDRNSLRNWFKDFPFSKHYQSMRNKYVGIPGCCVNDLTDFDDIWDDDKGVLTLPRQSFKWNHKDPWVALHEKVKRWAYLVN